MPLPHFSAFMLSLSMPTALLPVSFWFTIYSRTVETKSALHRVRAHDLFVLTSKWIPSNDSSLWSWRLV